MLEKLCDLASDDLLNVVCRSRLSLISLRAVVEGDQHLVSTSPPLPTSPTFWAYFRNFTVCCSNVRLQFTYIFFTIIQVKNCLKLA